MVGRKQANKLPAEMQTFTGVGRMLRKELKTKTAFMCNQVDINQHSIAEHSVPGIILSTLCTC